MRRLALAAIIWLASAGFFVAAAQQCAPRPALLQAAANLGERLVEHGVDGPSGSWVAITASRTSAFSFFMSPKGQPDLLCVVGTGTQFEQRDASTRMVLADTSVIVVTFDRLGDWQLIYMRAGHAAPPQIISTGTGWVREITIGDEI